MNDLIVKDVDVFGDSITAAKDGDGNIWVGIKWICKGLGMTEGQWKRQIKNIQKDMVLSKGGSNLILSTSSGERDVFCLKNDFLPLWLAKISITPNIRQNMPELADKLLEYQLRAKDVLSDAFIKKDSQLPMTTQEQIKLLAQGNVELNQKVDTLTERVDKIELDLPILPIEADRITTAVKKKGVSVLGGKESAAYKNRALRQKLYNNLYGNLKYNFGGIKSYKSIKRCQTDTAIEIVEKYEPPFFLANEIDMENAQMSI